MFYPATVEELKNIIAFCRENNRTITAAGTFNSFDQQNSGNDVVISMREMNTIEFNQSDATITVGAGAKWGDIFDVVYENGCALYNCITGTQPSAGGTLSINSNSMFTPGCGKEGTHCVSFDIVTSEGELFTCSREENATLFHGAIAGMGMLGFIVRITYEVHHVGQHYDIQIDVSDYDDVDDMEQKLDVRKSPNFDTLESLRSQSSLFYMDKGSPKLSVYNRYFRRVERKTRTHVLSFPSGVLASASVRFFPFLSDVCKNETREDRRIDAISCAD